MRFRDQDIVFANGSKGQNFEIPTANPLNYFHAISRSAELPGLSIDGKLFLPPADQRKADGKFPLVMVVPGSLGVAPPHLAHAEALVGDGFAAFVLDSFGARDVTSTVANQTQFSFASSAYDVLAAWQVLAAHPQIDAARIGAQGHSRGGSAVMTAAARRFADAVVGKGAVSDACSRPIPGAAISSSIQPSAIPKSVSSWAMPTNGVRRCRCKAIARRSALPAARSRCG